MFVTEPGDHVNLESLFLATHRGKKKHGGGGEVEEIMLLEKRKFK